MAAVTAQEVVGHTDWTGGSLLGEHNLLDDGQARRGRRGAGRTRVAGRAALTAA